MFLLVPAYPGCPGSKAVKRSLLLLVVVIKRNNVSQTSAKFRKVQNQQPPFYGHYAGQSALAGISSKELEDFVHAKFYCPHALADGNQRIRIRKKALEFSSTVLSTLSPYLHDVM